ncbi:Crp/Fnr family transcriptional regulator [Dissulfurirhabdus thermomarina]|uniref:Crp/Fnr family transcriptional regulator n=1 Tax=Dissulfurirhabdus thermomarina TaxID=1765737 RepID=A0A6N9TP06_DISTH|nr:Crp/Fnr family transcriptional regulator [Dissulfurirhabdus thermomarina]NDY43012.1 Crp/Fnr family transcriptional regulator [Dissulfurirhabdus thermomarina]NMX23833.1 Crp/Fnr family transcriptional regulator [Dissulfurirhabdus thermomarina]
MLERSDIDLLSRIPALSPPRAELLSLMKKTGVKRAYAPGEAVFWVGERVDRLFVVASGSVEVYKDDFEGRKLTLFKYYSGDIFCLATLNVERAFANARAVETSTLISFEKRVVDEIIAACPDFGLNFLGCLSSKLVCFSIMVDDLAFKDLTSRLAKLLLVTRETSRPNRMKLSLEELAARLGTCQEVVSRALRKLREEGLVERRGHRILITDPDGLRDRAERGHDHGDGER